MSDTAFRKIWTYLAAFTFTFCVFALVHLSGQKTENKLGILGVAHTDFMILALPVIAVAALVVQWLVCVHRNDIGGPNWAARLPVTFFQASDVDPESKGGRLFQGAVFIATLLVPLIASLCVFGRFLAANVYLEVTRDTCCASSALCRPAVDCKADSTDCWIVTPYPGLDHLTMPAWSPPAQHGIYRFGSREGPEYFVGEAWLFAVLVIAVVGGAGVTIRSVLVRRPSVDARTHLPGCGSGRWIFQAAPKAISGGNEEKK